MKRKHVTDTGLDALMKTMSYKSNELILIYWLQSRARVLHLSEDGMTPDPGALKHFQKLATACEIVLRERGCFIDWSDRMYRVVGF